MQRLAPRLAGAVLVAALHVPVVFALLVVNLAPGVQRTEIVSETLVVLPLALSKAATAPAKGPVQNGSASAAVPSDLKLPFAAPPAMSSALGLPLFACAPENLRNLTREQREACLKLAAGRYVALRQGLPLTIKPPGPAWEGLRNSDIRARERNTADPCMAAKATGTDCIHDVLFGKGLW